MIALLKRSALIAAIILGSLGLLFLWGYFSNSPEISVRKTVSQDASIPSIDVNGTRLHIQSWGEEHEDVIIGLHGGPGNDSGYLHVLSQLSDQYKVVVYDQRGSGLSERLPLAELTMELFIDDLKDIIDSQRKSGQLILIGHSWGAMLGVAFTAKYPGYVDRLVLAEPGFLNNSFFKEYMTRTNNVSMPINWDSISYMAAVFFESLHINGPDDYAREDYFMFRLAMSDVEGHPLEGYYKDGKMPDNIEDYRFGTTVATAFVAKYIDQDGNLTYNFADGIQRYDKEILMLSSEYNSIIGTEYQEKQRALLADSVLVEVPGAGHMMFNSQTDTSLRILRDWLKS